MRKTVQVIAAMSLVFSVAYAGEAQQFPLVDPQSVQITLEGGSEKTLSQLFPKSMATPSAQFILLHDDPGSLVSPQVIAPLMKAFPTMRAQSLSVELSPSEIKKAYRRVMSKHHPDKLIAQGLPEDMIKIATDKTQQIQAAYERIRVARNMT